MLRVIFLKSINDQGITTCDFMFERIIARLTPRGSVHVCSMVIHLSSIKPVLLVSSTDRFNLCCSDCSVIDMYDAKHSPPYC